MNLASVTPSLLRTSYVGGMSPGLQLSVSAFAQTIVYQLDQRFCLQLSQQCASTWTTVDQCFAALASLLSMEYYWSHFQFLEYQISILSSIVQRSCLQVSNCSHLSIHSISNCLHQCAITLLSIGYQWGSTLLSILNPQPPAHLRVDQGFRLQYCQDDSLLSRPALSLLARFAALLTIKYHCSFLRFLVCTRIITIVITIYYVSYSLSIKN